MTSRRALPLCLIWLSLLGTRVAAQQTASGTAVAEGSGSISISIYQRCARRELPRSACSFHWASALREAGAFLAMQHAGNLILYKSIRYETTHGPFLRKYADSVTGHRWDRWDDGDSALLNYAGHPMMGAIAGFIYIQNDPRSADVEVSKTRSYWTGRMRAMAWSAAYSVQWEIGPISESSIGNKGLTEYYSEHSHQLTNGTGLVDFVMTPLAGTSLLIAEDLLDKYAIKRLEQRSRRRGWLLAISLLNPNRSAANLLRLKPPYHRDSRRVR